MHGAPFFEPFLWLMGWDYDVYDQFFSPKSSHEKDIFFPFEGVNGVECAAEEISEPIREGGLMREDCVVLRMRG